MGNTPMTGTTRRLTFMVLVAVIGCSHSPPPPKVNEFENLNKIQQAYTDAFNRLGRGPADFQEFRPFLQKYGNPDEILISSHDKQSYEIRWGVSLRTMTETRKAPIIAYEKQGVKGERYVLTTAGILTMTDEELEREKRSKLVEFTKRQN
jgi:hypothetical protein